MNQKKIFSALSIFLLSGTIAIPLLVKAAGLVPCTDNCTLANFFTMLGNIYHFIVWDIATPLAIVSLCIGGILMLISAGNPNLMSLGKKIFFSAIIGLVLVFGSYLIIDFVLTAVGWKTPGSWATISPGS